MIGIIMGLICSGIIIYLTSLMDVAFAGSQFGDWFKLAITVGGGIIGWFIEAFLNWRNMSKK